MNKGEAETPIAKIDFDEAMKLSDLRSILQDLDSVMQICSRLKKLLQENSQDNLLVESFWATALIKYARCFKSGKRVGLDESIFNELNGDAHEVHEFYLDMRNKHIAHSVNPFEQMQVGVALSPQESCEKKVVGITTLSVRHIVADFEGVHRLGLLSKIIHGKALELANEYQEKTLVKVAEIQIDDLYGYPRLRITAPGPSESNNPRE